MIEPEIRAHVLDRLHAAAREEGARVLFAAESGSRAWGFPSPDSDYDVRFIYAHPLGWYLSLVPGRDVIERPLDQRLVDLAGWDVRKALQLLLRSNPALYEWLSSPIVYIDDGVFRPAARALFERHASPATLAHHYASIARGHWDRNIAGRERVRLKRYLYVLRPVLSLASVAAHGRPPPMSLDELVAAVELPGEVRRAIDDLIALKRATPELGDGARLAVLDRWLEARMAELEPARLALADRDPAPTRAEADRLFLALIGAPQEPA